MFRKLLVTGLSASLLALAGFATSGHLAAKAAGNVAVCTVSGSASSSTGLGPPPGGPTTFNFIGSISCTGTLSGGGTFSGSTFCPSGNLVYCGVGLGGTVSFNATVGAHTIVGVNCLLTQAGAVVKVSCFAAAGFGSWTIDGSPGILLGGPVVFTPTNVGAPPVKNVNFTGVILATY
ncbi:MAG: hypothetical protein JOY80_02650 [Candidatus Dormibacteraeota bacterium]|nr:hypothetical protein [Candidatus Dormibacteraeota bacterium]